MSKNSIYWFRKCLRLHDNPALLYALQNSQSVYPIFILDPWFVENAKVGPNRWRFLLESLNDLNNSLIKKNSRLLLIRGKPLETLKEKIKEWNIDLVCFESDTEPYAKQRDSHVANLLTELNVKLVTKCSHTLWDPNVLNAKNSNKPCLTYQSFQSLIAKLGDPDQPVGEPDLFPKKLIINDETKYNMPSLSEIGVDESKCGPLKFPGGETEALKRLKASFQNESWIANFEKPNTEPNSLQPSTTVLSPYLKFGCISPKIFYFKLKEVYAKHKKHSMPPVSLEGQLLWREFFYFVGAFTPNFDKIEGNPLCRKIKWDNNEELFKAWKEARTGYPFIDAIMTQLKQEGWIHHLARHAVACFLTRGDLYQSWTKGQEVFEEYLLDADYSLNAANWQWLSASAFFHQYWRVYSPIEFGKKTDKNGDYIRKYLPVLKNFPSKFIFEPWTASQLVQTTAKCIIGKDYPKPIVDHKSISKINMTKMKSAFEDIRTTNETTKPKVASKQKAQDDIPMEVDSSPKKKKAKITDHFKTK